MTYHVELSGSTWWCDCPVGDSGAFCKHCVAALAVATGGASSDTDSADVDLASYDSRDSLGVDGLVALVKDELTPRRRFYAYGQANQYAVDAAPVVDLLVAQAQREGSAALLGVLQRAITLQVRTILRSDDSSGLQGMQIRQLLEAHQRVASNATLTPKEAKALATWLHKFAFDGTQDFFEVDIDRYALAVGERGVAHYRSLLEATAAKLGESDFAVQYARGRLLILERDVDAIVAHFGGGANAAYAHQRIVEALDDAGLSDEAATYARRGVAADPRSWQVAPLVDRVVADALERADWAEAVHVRRMDFENRPSHQTYHALRRVAVDAKTWDSVRPDADTLLAERDPRAWVLTLIERHDIDAAWEAATTHPEGFDHDLWIRLCQRRATTDPASTLPYYADLIRSTLQVTGRASYNAAAKLLRTMRDVAKSAAELDEYDRFLAEIVDENRRRPTFGQTLRRASLL